MTQTKPCKITTPAQLLESLKSLKIGAITHNHLPLMTVADSQNLRGEIDGQHAKNLFLKDKKQKLWLVVCEENAKVDLKQLKKCIGSASLSFAKPELLIRTLGIQPGSVTPFAIINDQSLSVQVVLDRDLAEGACLNFHPLTNTQTTSLSGAELLRFLKSYDHAPIIIDFNQEPS